jgi:nucleoside recognition membrane protein YjiH
MIREREVTPLPGLPVVLVLIAATGLTIWGAVDAAQDDAPLLLVTYLLLAVLSVFLMAGLFVVNPNEGKVLQFFGDYVGTVKQPGLRWANPLYSKAG